MAKSTAAAEIPADGVAFEEVEIFKQVKPVICIECMRATVIVFSDVLYHTLSSKRNTANKSVRSDGNLMQF